MMQAQNIIPKTKTLSPELLKKLNAYWCAANYLSVGQIYLYDNPLLKKPLTLEHIKPRLLGHWGTTPGLNFIYVHLNRIIKKYDLFVMSSIYEGFSVSVLEAMSLGMPLLLSDIASFREQCEGTAVYFNLKDNDYF